MGTGWFTNTSLAAAPQAGEVDLLTVMTHELGHLFGLMDGNGTALMASTLSPGTRILPTASDLLSPHTSLVGYPAAGDQTDLAPVAISAFVRWASASLSDPQFVATALAQVQISDVPGQPLGLAQSDAMLAGQNPAGYGWFIDSTPAGDEEFAPSGSGSQLQAIDSQAVDHVDLLTVVENELGHAAGLGDPDSSATSLMSDMLPTGVRRLPGANEVDAIFAEPGTAWPRRSN